MSQCILSDEGSGVSEYLCNRNETLEYSLKHGEVITNILGDTFPYIWQIGPLVAGSLVIAFMTYGVDADPIGLTVKQHQHRSDISFMSCQIRVCKNE